MLELRFPVVLNIVEQKEKEMQTVEEKEGNVLLS